MIGDGGVLLHLVHLLGVAVRRRVLVAVDHAGLHRLVDIRERQHLRNGAERAHFRLQHLGRLDAHLQALEVGHMMHRLVRRHDLEAVVPIGQPLDALGLELGEQALPDRPLGDASKRRLVRNDVGQIEHLEFLDPERAELGERGRQHLHRAELQRFEFFLVLVELRIRVDFDLDLAVGVFFRQFLELECAFALRRVGRDHVAEFDDDRLLRRRRPDQGGHRDRQGGQHEFSHFFVSLFVFLSLTSRNRRQRRLRNFGRTIASHGSQGHCPLAGGANACAAFCCNANVARQHRPGNQAWPTPGAV